MYAVDKSSQEENGELVLECLLSHKQHAVLGLKFYECCHQHN